MLFFNPFRQSKLADSEVTKPLLHKIYKSLIVLYTAPLSRGKKVTLDKYSGVVQGMGLWYVKLRSQHKSIYIPTSFIYDKVIEMNGE